MFNYFVSSSKSICASNEITRSDKPVSHKIDYLQVLRTSDELNHSPCSTSSSSKQKQVRFNAELAEFKLIPKRKSKRKEKEIYELCSKENKDKNEETMQNVRDTLSLMSLNESNKENLRNDATTNADARIQFSKSIEFVVVPSRKNLLEQFSDLWYTNEEIDEFCDNYAEEKVSDVKDNFSSTSDKSSLSLSSQLKKKRKSKSKNQKIANFVKVKFSQKVECLIIPSRRKLSDVATALWYTNDEIEKFGQRYASKEINIKDSTDDVASITNNVSTSATSESSLSAFNASTNVYTQDIPIDSSSGQDGTVTDLPTSCERSMIFNDLCNGNNSNKITSSNKMTKGDSESQLTASTLSLIVLPQSVKRRLPVPPISSFTNMFSNFYKFKVMPSPSSHSPLSPSPTAPSPSSCQCQSDSCKHSCVVTQSTTQSQSQSQSQSFKSLKLPHSELNDDCTVNMSKNIPINNPVKKPVNISGDRKLKYSATYIPNEIQA